MIDYWSKLRLNECWSEKQRYNIIMNALLSEEEGDNGQEQQDQQEVQKGTVNVTVTDGNEGIGNVSVVLSKDGSEDTYTCPNGTGGAGGCTISNVPYDTYDVTATCEGYETEETTVTVDAETVELEITLTLAEQQEPNGQG